MEVCSMKPILYHDIDGVLFGDYAGEFQLRPGTKSWIKWAHEHFDIVFLTMWRHEEIDTLLAVLTVEKSMKSLQAPGFHSANWQKYENKELWVADAVAKTGKRDWLWIDDQVPNVGTRHWGRVLYSYIGTAAVQMRLGCMTSRGTIAAS
jgi:hypothetical protein